jgi:RNA polymerase sigma-70 factor (family 1)
MNSQKDKHTYTALTDTALIELLKKDDMHAFDELYSRYFRSLYAFAYKRVKSKEIAEEIVQEFLTNLWLKRKDLIINTSFIGYIYTSVRNLILNAVARELRRKAYQQYSRLFNQESDNSTEQTINLNELNRNLQREIKHLPERCRSVFELSRNDHKTNKEIALELGISEKTVEGHLTNAIKWLRIHLNSILFYLILLINISYLG